MLDAASQPSSTRLRDLTVAQAGVLLRTAELTSRELAEDALLRIGEQDAALHAFVLVTEELALQQAEQADRELRAGLDRGPLHGIPYALKDIFDVAGLPTSNCSWLSVDRVAEQDSTVQARLRSGGAVLLGKLTTYEYAVGGPSFDLPFPPARNPWSTAHIPNGSSSGAGVAVAAGLVRVAIGSDTSGSIRGPAFHCGTVGLKPTYGRVSGWGAQQLSYTMDHFGPLAWTVADTAAALGVVAGPDPRDPRTGDAGVADYLGSLSDGVAGLRIGWSPSWYADDPLTLPEISAAIEQALAVLREHGAQVIELRPPDYDLFNAAGRLIMAAESFAVHEANLREHPESFGRYMYQRTMPGAGVTAADLLRARRARRRLTAQLQDQVFGACDVLVTACGQATAARFEDYLPDWPPPKLANDMQTIPFSLTGNPAMSLPTGFANDGLPIGVQLVGKPFDESVLFRVAAMVETELGQRDRRPPAPGSGPDQPGR